MQQSPREAPFSSAGKIIYVDDKLVRELVNRVERAVEQTYESGLIDVLAAQDVHEALLLGLAKRPMGTPLHTSDINAHCTPEESVFHPPEECARHLSLLLAALAYAASSGKGVFYVLTHEFKS